MTKVERGCRCFYTHTTVQHTYRAVIFDTVIPETRGRELLSDDYSHAVY